MITAIVLTKNNERTLKACLESLRFADELIVADDKSTDDTLPIAKSFHATILNLTPSESFADKRNQALKMATHPWVLFVDSDEVVTLTLQDSIMTAIKQDQTAGYLIKRTDIFMDKKLKHGETGNMWLLRLAQKGNGEWKRCVHEYWDIDGKIQELEGELLHYAHENIESFIEKINRYTELEVQERKGKKSRIQLYLELCVYPLAKFIQNYFFKLGFLDEFPGFVMASMMSLHSLCIRIKMIESDRK